MKKGFRHSRSGFTLIELLIGMTIFSMALTSIYLLLTSTMKSVTYSRNEIVVSNLLREEMELIRNIRDSNVAKAAAWDAWKVENDTSIKTFQEGFYTVENNFEQRVMEFDGDVVTSIPVKIQKLENMDVNNFENEALKEKFEKTQLCFDNEMRYVHCDENKTNPTVFASYVHIFPMYFYENANTTDKKFIEETVTVYENDQPTEVEKSQGYIIDARVIVRDGSTYREYDAKTAITDWRK